MSRRTQRILAGVAIIFLLYFIVVAPEQAADLFRTVFGTIADGVEGIFEFFEAVING